MDFQRLTQNMPESVVVTDTAGKIQFVNPAFTKVTGYLPEEVIGQNPRILKSGRQDYIFIKACGIPSQKTIIGREKSGI
jgi:NNP family nitrate/nitrite transporter-like MFS transporter